MSTLFFPFLNSGTCCIAGDIFLALKSQTATLCDLHMSKNPSEATTYHTECMNKLHFDRNTRKVLFTRNDLKSPGPNEMQYKVGKELVDGHAKPLYIIFGEI